MIGPLKGSLLTLTLVAALSRQASADELVSIEGINLESDGYVSGFSIDTWDVQILAVCHLPKGWTITAGRNVSFDGHLTGAASGFMLNLNRLQLGELKDLFLIETPDFARVKSATEPPMFGGSITIGQYKKPTDSEVDGRTVPLQPSNIVLRPAGECPKPRG